MNRIRSLSLICLCALLTSCAGTYKSNLKFNAQEPLRVAILPFVSTDSAGLIIQEEGRLIVDNLGLISSEVEETPAQTVRKSVISELQKSKLDLISTAAIDIDLPHRGFAKPDGSLDLVKLLNTPASELCTKALSCDAILTGKITRWDRSYYGLQSVNTVAMDFSLISAKDNSILFSTTAQDSESRGLTKIPTGFSSLILEPIRGLDSEIIADLSTSVIRKMLAQLTQRPKLNVTQSPPAIYATAHDGKGRQITFEQPLIIVAFGSEKSEASFSVGSVVPKIPLIEVYPGHYYGEYIPLEGEVFSNQVVSLGLTDAQGRSTYSEVSGGTISYP